MSLLEILGVLASGLITIAALSLIVNPNGRFPEVVGSIGKAISDNISTAKSFS